MIAIVYLTIFDVENEKNSLGNDNNIPIKTAIHNDIITYETSKSNTTSSSEYYYSDINPLLDDLLQKLASNNLDSLSKDDIFNVSRFMQESTNNLDKEYEKIRKLYKNLQKENQKSFLLYFLGDIGSAQSAQTLLNIIDSQTNPSPKIRYDTAQAIRDLAYDKEWNKPNYEVSSTLETYIKESSNTTYTYEILDTLTHIGKPSGIEVVLDNLEQGDSTTKQDATDILKNILNEDATAVLLERYNDPNTNSETKQAILDSLSYQPNKNATEALYDYASKLPNDSDVEQVVTRFEILKQYYPKSENIIKEKLYDKNTEFQSEAIRDAIEGVYKKDK